MNEQLTFPFPEVQPAPAEDLHESSPDDRYWAVAAWLSRTGHARITTTRLDPSTRRVLTVNLGCVDTPAQCERTALMAIVTGAIARLQDLEAERA